MTGKHYRSSRKSEKDSVEDKVSSVVVESMDTNEEIQEDDRNGGESQAAKSKDAFFPMKLFDIVSDEKTDDIIKWLPSGNAFIIVDKKRFVQEVLVKHFQQSQFDSFTCMLRRWKFTRVQHNPFLVAYSNKLFLKDNGSLCFHMRCKNENVSVVVDLMDKKDQDQDSVKSDEGATIDNPSESMEESTIDNRVTDIDYNVALESIFDDMGIVDFDKSMNENVSKLRFDRKIADNKNKVEEAEDIPSQVAKSKDTEINREIENAKEAERFDDDLGFIGCDMKVSTLANRRGE